MGGGTDLQNLWDEATKPDAEEPRAGKLRIAYLAVIVVGILIVLSVTLALSVTFIF